MNETFEVLDRDETEDRPLNWLVTWRVERRFGEPIICSTFIAPRQELESLQIPKFLLPETQEVKVTIENYISNNWRCIRRSFSPLEDLIPDSALVGCPIEIVSSMT